MWTVDLPFLSGGLAVQVGWLGLRVGGHLGAESAFIKLTGWTLAMALPWWQHHKYHLSCYYYYYHCQLFCRIFINLFTHAYSRSNSPTNFAVVFTSITNLSFLLRILTMRLSSSFIVLVISSHLSCYTKIEFVIIIHGVKQIHFFWSRQNAITVTRTSLNTNIHTGWAKQTFAVTFIGLVTYDNQVAVTVIVLNILWYTSRNQDDALSSATVCNMTPL